MAASTVLEPRNMTAALILAAALMTVSGLLLFAWPIYARGFDSVQDWWSYPGNRTLAVILVAIIAAPIALTNGPLAGGAMMVQLEPDMINRA